MAEKLIELVSGIPLTWQVFVLAMFPVTELRAAIPFGIARGLTPSLAFGIAVTGNLLIGLPVLLLVGPVIDLLVKVPRGKKIISKILTKTRKKGGKVAKYGVVGLAIFIAFPVPGTGVWTGSLLAYLFGISFGKAFLAMGAGIFLAGAIVTVITVGMVEILGLTLPWIIGFIVGLIMLYYLSNFLNRHGKK